jgi:hypothetical protein
MNQNAFQETFDQTQPRKPLDQLNPEEISSLENKYSDDFVSHMEALQHRFVVLKHPGEKKVCVKRASESSRYSEPGARKLKKRIHQRLGSYAATDGILLTLTIAEFDANRKFYEGMSRLSAWESINREGRGFTDELNKYRKAHGLKKIRAYVKALEEQPARHYPHLHIWFPGLKWLAPISVIQGLWPYGNVDIKRIWNTSPGEYIIKYISKMQGKDSMHVMLWAFHLRLFSTSRGLQYGPEIHADNGWRYSSSGGYFTMKEEVERLIAEGYSVTDPTLIQPRGG